MPDDEGDDYIKMIINDANNNDDDIDVNGNHANVVNHINVDNNANANKNANSKDIAYANKMLMLIILILMMPTI